MREIFRCIHLKVSFISFTGLPSLTREYPKPCFQTLYKYRDYGEKCDYNVSILINCEPSIEIRERIYQQQKFPCRDKHRYSVKKILRKIEAGSNKPIYPPLLETSLSKVKAGHVNFGMKGLNIPGGGEPLYISWMRDPFHMLISLALYLMEKPTFTAKKNVENAKQLIIQKLRNPKRLVSKDRLYSQYAAYFRTNGTVGTEDMSPEEVRSEIFANMDKISLIGILEFHETSIRMLQRVLDPSLTLNDNFWVKKREKINRSKVVGLSKEKLFDSILTTEGLMKDIKNALAFDQSIYEYGLKLHSIQRKELLS